MRSIPLPTILSESGRALASQHAVMVFDVLTRYSTLLHKKPSNLLLNLSFGNLRLDSPPQQSHIIILFPARSLDILACT